jgi:hypothetical protein
MIPGSILLSLPGMDALLAYGLPGPGPEFIPYFLGLLFFGASALIGVLMWPIHSLRRRFRKKASDEQDDGNGGAGAANVPEAPGASGSQVT